MTRRTNARIAGFTYLFYIAVAYPSLVMMTRATKGNGIAEKLATIAGSADAIRLSVILSFLCVLSALTLAVTLYAITRDEDQEIALFGLACRTGEGIVGAVSILFQLGLLLVASPDGRAIVAVPSAVYPLADFLVRAGDWSTLVSASLFAMGSTAFSYLLLRGRIVPVPIAALGVLGSLAIVIGLPAQTAGYITRSVTDIMFLPVAGFEVSLALWLIIKGAAMPRVAKVAGEYQLAGTNG